MSEKDMSVVEASQLNFAPGNWPERVLYMGMWFHRADSETGPDQELLCVNYYTRFSSKKLVVLND